MSELDDVIAGWGIFGEDIKPMFNEVANQGDLWWWEFDRMGHPSIEESGWLPPAEFIEFGASIWKGRLNL